MAALAVVVGTGAGQAGPAGAPGAAAGGVAVRMDEAMAWPSRFAATVELTPLPQAAGGSSASGQPAAAPRGTVGPGMRLDLTGFPPDLFNWESADSGQDPRGGVAWNGLVEWRREGPGPRFSYTYQGVPFLEALRLYFTVFRPLPPGARLRISGSATVAGRQAVEAVLQEASGRETALAVDAASGLILRATSTSPERRLLVQAVPVRTAGPLQRVEYEVPALGPGGRMVVERVGGRWFLTEAIAGDPPHRVRLSRLRFGQEVTAAPPDRSRLERLVQLRQQGQSLLTRRQYREALPVLRELVALDPYLPEAHNQLGLAAMQTGDWLLAASAFDQIIHLNPRSPVGYNNLAYLYTRYQVNLTRALELAERAMALSGQRPDATVLDTYGWVLVHLGRAQEAVRVLEQALSLSGQDPVAQAEILYHLGVAHWRLNRKEEARRLLSRALELDPELGEARQALGQLSAGEGAASP